MRIGVSFAILLALLAPQAASAATLTLYSRLTIAPAIAKAFTAQTGIKIRLRRPPPSGMVARIIAEGSHPRWSLAWFYGASTAVTLDRSGLVARHLPIPAGLTPLGSRLVDPDGAYVPTGIVLTGAVLMAKSSPFAPPTQWSDLNDPAYHGLVGVNDPQTSDQSFPTIAGLLQSAGGWPDGQAYVMALMRNGLHIYADTRTTIAALRSGAIQIAIVRSSAAYHMATTIDPSLRVVVPRPAIIVPSVIVMAKSISPATRAAAARFIAYVNSPAGQAIGRLAPGTDTDVWPISSDVTPHGALPPLTSISPQVPDAREWGARQHLVTRWFVTKIVGPGT